MDVSYLLDALNPAQREAVTAPPGHHLVLAGAGSGKTRVLTHRIAWLNEVFGVPAHGIFAVTFTNKAAGEMRARAEALLQRGGSHPGSRGLWIGTFHGLAHRLLRLHWQDAGLPEGFQVLDSDDQLRLVKRVVQQLLIDEFQDTNGIQYGFVRLLAGDSGRVFVVGDDDQAIYGWRGAKVENVQRFLRDYPGASTLRLEQNYRSTSNILNAANAVIAHNPDRLGKQLWTDAGEGDPIDLYAAYNEIDESRYVVERIRQWVRDGGSHGDCAILYRSNAQSRAFEEALLGEQMPFRVYGGQRFFERAEIKDTLAYLRLVANRADDAAFERAVNTPTRGIGERTLDEVRRRAREEAISLWEAAKRVSEGTGLAARARNAIAGFLLLVEGLQVETDALPLQEKID